ncbi:unnamed protein product [Closterium sp. NIES-53]
MTLREILRDALLFFLSSVSGGFSAKCCPSPEKLRNIAPKSRQSTTSTDRSGSSQMGPSLSPPKSRISQATPRFAGFRPTSFFVSRAAARRAFLSLLLLLVATAVLRSFCVTWRCAHGSRRSRSTAFGGGGGDEGIVELADSVATGERPKFVLRRNSRLWNIFTRSREPSDCKASHRCAGADLESASAAAEVTAESAAAESASPHGPSRGEPPRLFVPLPAATTTPSSASSALSIPATSNTATIPLPAPREHRAPSRWAAAGGAASDRLSSAVAGATGELRRLLGGAGGAGDGSTRTWMASRLRAAGVNLKSQWTAMVGGGGGGGGGGRAGGGVSWRRQAILIDDKDAASAALVAPTSRTAAVATIDSSITSKRYHAEDLREGAEQSGDEQRGAWRSLDDSSLPHDAASHDASHASSHDSETSHDASHVDVWDAEPDPMVRARIVPGDELDAALARMDKRRPVMVTLANDAFHAMLLNWWFHVSKTASIPNVLVGALDRSTAQVIMLCTNVLDPMFVWSMVPNPNALE